MELYLEDNWMLLTYSQHHLFPLIFDDFVAHKNVKVIHCQLLLMFVYVIIIVMYYIGRRYILCIIYIGKG